MFRPNYPITRRALGAALLATVALGLFAAACGDDDPKPTATPSPVTTTATPKPTESQTPPSTGTATSTPQPIINPNVEAGGSNGFQSFASKLQAALAKGDASALTSRMKPLASACTAADVAAGAGEPTCKKVGDATNGFAVGRWKSEGGVINYSAATKEVADFIAHGQPTAKDSYGDGAARIYAISPTGEQPALVITAIVSQDGKMVRQGLLVRMSFTDAKWTVNSYMTAPVLVEDWLAPTADAHTLLPDWTKFEG